LYIARIAPVDAGQILRTGEFFVATTVALDATNAGYFTTVLGNARQISAAILGGAAVDVLGRGTVGSGQPLAADGDAVAVGAASQTAIDVFGTVKFLVTAASLKATGARLLGAVLSDTGQIAAAILGDAAVDVLHRALVRHGDSLTAGGDAFATATSQAAGDVFGAVELSAATTRVRLHATPDLIGAVLGEARLVPSTFVFAPTCQQCHQGLACRPLGG
jgi:hypothetical protein